MLTHRTLSEDEIDRRLFCHFIRRQVVTACWRRDNGTWVIKDDPFIDDWTEGDYAELIADLRRTARTGGLAQAAFCHGQLKGFVCVDAAPLGSAGQYRDLLHLYVSEDLRGQGVGTALFDAACAWARGQGAAKLYISAHSAVESQAFYRARGCVEAAEYQQGHVEREPYDCQLERAL